MLGRGCAVGLIGAVAGLAVVATAADVGARRLATSRIEQRITTSVPEASGIHARIHSFPFLKIAANGHLEEVGAHLDRVVETPLTFTDVDVDLRGVQLQASDLVTAAKVTITHIDQGTIRLAVTADDLARAAGVSPAVVRTVLSGVGGAAGFSVDATGRRLVIRAAGIRSVTLALPGAQLLPCVPRMAATPDRLTLTCSFDRVPAAFTSTSAA